MPDQFEAFRIYQDARPFKAGVETLSLDDLTPGDTVIKVAYSGVNYKDALAGSGKTPILRTSPLNGGIDLAGTVVESRSGQYQPGDIVLAQGSGLSERYDGGYAEYARLPDECLLPIPPVLTAFEAMVIGTAGFTAALAIDQMETNGQKLQTGPVLVTGASGGVGSFAVRLLSQLGYECVAATRKPSARDYLQHLGATEVISAIDPVTDTLGKQQWSGGIDNLGGQTLASVLKTTKMSGNVVSIGLLESADLSISVMPFIIRGVNLLGVSSANCPRAVRERIWQRLGEDMKPGNLDTITNEVIGLRQLPQAFEKLLTGQVQGRIIIEMRH